MNREQVKALLPVLQAFAEGRKVERYLFNADLWKQTDRIDISGDYRIAVTSPETHDWTWACKMLAAGKAVRRTSWMEDDRYIIEDGAIWVRSELCSPFIAKILATDITAEDWVLYGDE
jgi:hypothetical protein